MLPSITINILSTEEKDYKKVVEKVAVIIHTIVL